MIYLQSIGETFNTGCGEWKLNFSHDFRHSSLGNFSHFISKGILHRFATFSFFLAEQLISVNTRFSLVQKQFHIRSQIYFRLFLSSPVNLYKGKVFISPKKISHRLANFCHFPQLTQI